MSEPVSNDVSTESLCTVIETSSNEYLSNKLKEPLKSTSLESLDTNKRNSFNETQTNLKTNGCLRNSSLDEGCDTDATDRSFNTTEEEDGGGSKKEVKTKLKKSVSFDPNDEKIRKFITGEPIVDQQNPFKTNGYLSNGSAKRKEKKTPPPVPAKRSTLSVRKTVTQQLREREREKEKERERLKNEANNRKSNGIIKSPSDEFVTTEEVLKQSKYVKTYIKNPDPYFVYDPTVLARIKFEELREIALKKPPKKLQQQQQQQQQTASREQQRDRFKDLKNRQNDNKHPKLPLSFKKCSKPNYPELSDLKIKTGTDLEDSLYNPLEVTKNAKKFDERVKKLHISSDDDLDEIEEPLTKSESSDDNNMSQQMKTNEQEKMPANEEGNISREPSPPPQGTFTNTIKSKEFQEYLEKKGLTLIPKKIPNGAQNMYTKPQQTAAIKQISFKAEPERIHFSTGQDSVDAAENNRKPSVFQRLLANSIFASRRKTTPKEQQPNPKSVYDCNKPNNYQENGSIKPIKRVVLERQSFHGRPKTGNLLSPAEALELKQQMERSRKSYASGDNLSVSISSALTDAENNENNGSTENPLTNKSHNPTLTPGLRRKELQTKTIAKPPRRTLSRERMNKHDTNPKTILSERPTTVNNNLYTLPRENLQKNDTNFRRSLERQSMIPKRTSQTADRQQVFPRSSSMDRNEILRRNAARIQQQRSNSVTGETLLAPAPITTRTKENLKETSFPVNEGPAMTSTPIRDGQMVRLGETKTISPISSIPKKASQLGVYVDQQEWEKLRAIKEQTDRELYFRVMQQQQKLQQQQQQQGGTGQSQTNDKPLENIYEHLPGGSQVRLAPANDGSFTRGSPQRNTFSGVIRSNNRQVKIIDGKPIVGTETLAMPPQTIQTAPVRCQSVLDGMTQGQANSKRGYESETPETPVVLRRKQDETAQPTRRIGGLLTREEILQKIKEFCRKSLNKTPTNQTNPPLQSIYEKQPTDLSPVSYVSVETHQRPASRMYAAPQVPQRMHSLPTSATGGHFVPIAQEIVTDPNTNSPIYAHVVKRGSLQSNPSELYEIPQRSIVTTVPPTQYLVRREPELKPVYIRQGTLQRPESAFSPAATQYILVDGDKLQPAQIITAYPQNELYAQPQYIRPHQLQNMPGTAYGYITVREPVIHQQPVQIQQQQQQQQHQIIRPRLHDGRSTPLILDRSSSQQVSQIYWTPQHQRLQHTQQAGLLTDQISPRYALKQSYVMSSPQQQQQQQQLQQQQNRATPTIMMLQQPPKSQHSPLQLNGISNNNIPTQRQQYSPIVRETTTTPIHLLQQQQQIHNNKPQQPQIQEITTSNTVRRQSPAFDWESGSEAGEVQRIMEKQQQNDLKFIHLDLQTSQQLQQNG